jgi:hypothetical protein
MTATLELIMQQVKYLATSFGGLEVDHFRLTTLGRMAKQLATKNQDGYESAKALQKTIREYDRLLDQGHRKMNAENLSITKSEEFISSKI